MKICKNRLTFIRFDNIMKLQKIKRGFIMKKLFTMMISAVMLLASVFSLTACGGNTVKVGSQSGTTGAMYASALKGVELLNYDTFALAAQDLKNGKVEYVIVDGATGKSLQADIEGLKIIDVELSSEYYGIAVDKAQPELLTQINAVLAEKADDVNAIVEKYMNNDTANFVPVTSALKDETKAATQLVVATNAEFPPFESISGDKYIGIDMEIAYMIAQELDMELVIDNMSFDAVVTSIGTHGVDIGMSGLTITAERKQTVNFATPYYIESQYILTLASNTSLDNCMTVIDVLNVLTANK